MKRVVVGLFEGEGAWVASVGEVCFFCSVDSDGYCGGMLEVQQQQGQGQARARAQAHAQGHGCGQQLERKQGRGHEWLHCRAQAASKAPCPRPRRMLTERADALAAAVAASQAFRRLVVVVAYGGITKVAGRASCAAVRIATSPKRLPLENATTTGTAIAKAGGAPDTLRSCGGPGFSSVSSGSGTLAEQEAADRKDLPSILRLIRRQAEAEAWLKFQADMSAPIHRQIREISLGFPYNKEARGSFATIVNLAVELGVREGDNGARVSKNRKAKEKQRSQQSPAPNPNRDQVQYSDVEFEELLRDHYAKMKEQEKAWHLSRWVQRVVWGV